MLPSLGTLQLDISGRNDGDAPPKRSALQNEAYVPTYPSARKKVTTDPPAQNFRTVDSAFEAMDVTEINFGNYIYHSTDDGTRIRRFGTVGNIPPKLEKLTRQLNERFANIPVTTANNAFVSDTSQLDLTSLTRFVMTEDLPELSLRFPYAVVRPSKTVQSDHELQELYLTLFAANIGIGPEVLCAFPIIHEKDNIGMAYVFEKGAVNLRLLSSHDMSDESASEIGSQISTLIGIASSNHMIVGDLKPLNIVVRGIQSGEIEVRFIDFDNAYTSIADGSSFYCIEIINCLLFLNSILSSRMTRPDPESSIETVIEPSDVHRKLAMPTVVRLKRLWNNHFERTNDSSTMELCRLLDGRPFERMDRRHLKLLGVPLQSVLELQLPSILAKLVWNRIRLYGHWNQKRAIAKNGSGNSFLEKLVVFYTSI